MQHLIDLLGVKRMRYVTPKSSLRNTISPGPTWQPLPPHVALGMADLEDVVSCSLRSNSVDGFVVSFRASHWYFGHLGLRLPEQWPPDRKGGLERSPDNWDVELVTCMRCRCRNRLWERCEPSRDPIWEHQQPQPMVILSRSRVIARIQVDQPHSSRTETLAGLGTN